MVFRDKQPERAKPKEDFVREPEKQKVEDIFGVTEDDVQQIGKEFQLLLKKYSSAGIIAREFGLLAPDKPTRLKLVRAFLYGRFAEDVASKKKSGEELAEVVSRVLNKISQKAISRGDKRVVIDIVEALMDEGMDGVDYGLAGRDRTKKGD